MEKLSAAVWIKLYEDDLEKLDNRAEKEGRSRSQLIRVLLHKILEAEKNYEQRTI